MGSNEKYYLSAGLGIFLTMLLLLACTPAQIETQEIYPTNTAAPAALPQAAQTDVLGALIASNVEVNILKADNSTASLQRGETTNILVNDQVTQNETGQSTLRFLDDLEVELLREAEITIVDAVQESGGSIFVRLDQNFGHVRIGLNDQQVVRVTVETDDSTINTLREGTEFIVCFAPGKVTCVDVISGAVEVTSQGEKKVYNAGEATYYVPGQPPQPAICSKPEEVQDWLRRRRSAEADVPTLGQLVSNWPQESCESVIIEEVNITSTPTLEIPENPKATIPAGIPYVRINSLTIDDQGHFVVDYETFEYTEKLPGQHIHFFFNTVSPENAGVPGLGPWFLYGGPRPFTGYTVDDRPPDATQICALVANPDHSVQSNSGNCLTLPEIP